MPDAGALAICNSFSWCFGKYSAAARNADAASRRWRKARGLDRVEKAERALKLGNPGNHVRLLRLEVEVLPRPLRVCRAARTVVRRHVLEQLRDPLVEPLTLRGSIFDVGVKARNGSLVIFDRCALVCLRGVAIALELGKEQTIILAVGLGLFHHAIQQVHYLRNSFVTRRSGEPEHHDP
jgi:hypothetical protein